MEELQGFQRKYLRGLAHGIKPVVFVGQKGVTDAVILSMEEALNAHELIKVKFIDFKEKESKQVLSEELKDRTDSCLAGTIGHMSIFYRPNKDPKKRQITVPKTRKDIPA
ncbi:ribosome assembly RNA-binding protein YhbY [Desulfoluna spongiiphila]|uniref:ribosome assembly RNA-binding protein YhbY n=1 Tax=Desulfoluna spongiiphila TaxID=419481 RepID=UPI00125A7835|nr:ribosome assembly RNA-binding protein YhbY [Desulfoluna spongiiphila]VVS93122.1 rna-binding protein yhby [Desulfoluna spongiiphila]